MAAGALEQRFADHVAAVGSALAHADRQEPFGACCRGPILPGKRKSIEPIAARARPERVGAARQSLHPLVAKAAWPDDALLAAVRAQVLPALGPITAWIVDDTGFPKKGRHAVGVARQHGGELGEQGNCRVAVSLSAADGRAGLPVASRLDLPEAWAHDPQRRAEAGVPGEIAFATEPRIALAQIRAAPRRVGASRRGWRRLNRAGFAGGSEVCKDGAMGTKKPSKPYPAGLRERAARLVREQEAAHEAAELDRRSKP
jgi:SRSO17 transposase